MNVVEEEEEFIPQAIASEKNANTSIKKGIVMDETYCEVRIFVLTVDNVMYTTDPHRFITAPSTKDYANILFAETYEGVIPVMNAENVYYIVAVLDWFMPDGNHSAFPMMLNGQDVWPTLLEA